MDGLIPAHILAARNGLSGFTSEYMKLGGKFGKGVLKWEVEGKLLGMDFIKICKQHLCTKFSIKERKMKTSH